MGADEIWITKLSALCLKPSHHYAQKNLSRKISHRLVFVTNIIDEFYILQNYLMDHRTTHCKSLDEHPSVVMGLVPSQPSFSAAVTELMSFSI